MVQATRHILDLGNKCFISILLTLWMYKPCYLSLLVLQGIKIATVYSPSHPCVVGASVTITARRVILQHLSHHPVKDIHDFILPLLWNDGSPDEDKRAQTDCCSGNTFEITDILCLGLGLVPFWKCFFILGTLISEVVLCFQKATKREENKLFYFYLYFSVVYMNKGIKIFANCLKNKKNYSVEYRISNLDINKGKICMVLY